MDDNAIDFFVFVCLGITPAKAKNDKDKALKKCFYRAYLDMNRTIRYKDDMKDNEIFLKAVFEKVECFYNNISDTEAEFNKKHKSTCKEITEIANSGYVERKFTDGQSQKILNMTLKYLMLLGDEKVCSCKKLLHAPIDNYIIKQVWKSDGQISVIPYKETKLNKNFDENGHRKPGVFSADKIEVWSSWDYDTYMKFQDYIKNNKNDYDSLIEWENNAWIKSASEN